MFNSDSLTELSSGLLQLLSAIVIAAFFWLIHRAIRSIRKQSHESFRGWIGFVKPVDTLRGRLLLVGGLTLFSLLVSLIEHAFGMYGELRALVQTGPVADMARIEPSSAATIAGLSYAFLKTGGSEEVLFRGLLYKRLIQWFGMKVANITQSLLFTLVHNGIIYAAMPDAPLWLHVDIFVRVFVLSWVLGWYIERRDGGSLFMAWLCHGIINFLTFLSFLWA